MADLTWQCSQCGNPIADGDGAIHVSHREVAEAEKADAEWQEGHSPDAAMTWEELVAGRDETARWCAHHDDCVPDHALEGDYWFAVERCRSHSDLAFWTLHLSEKAWYAATDWTTFARDVLIQSGAVDP